MFQQFLLGKLFLSNSLDKMKVLISYFTRGVFLLVIIQNLAGFELCFAKNIVQGEPLINQIFIPLSITHMNILHAFSHICHCCKSKIMAKFLFSSIVSTRLFAGNCINVLCFMEILSLIIPRPRILTSTQFLLY